MAKTFTRLSAAFASFALFACVEQSHDPQPSDDEIAAARAQLLTAAPTPRYPSQTVLSNPGGGKITYLGADADTESVTAGQSFTITHYFRVEKPTPEGWKLFVHLDTPDKKGHLTADHVPVNGKYPVPRWQAGEIIRDVQKVMLPPTWPGNKVLVYVGIWKGAARFKVEGGRTDGQNRALALELPVRGSVAPLPQKRLVVRKLKPGTVMTIDGKLDEPAWQDASSTGPFVNTMDGSSVSKAASARALWDAENLYVAFEFQDTDIISPFEKHDDKLWTQDAAELFIDPDGDGKTYIELQVSPRNVTYDSWLPQYRANDNAWDSGMVTAVQVNGTVNKSDDNDTGWTVEMRIPMTAVRGRMERTGGVPPTVGTVWRANFFRMDSQTGKPQSGSGWSPPMVGDYHALDKFGALVFGDEEGQTRSQPAAQAPLQSEGAPLAPHAPGAVVLPQVLQKAALAKPKPDAAPPAKPAKTK